MKKKPAAALLAVTMLVSACGHDMQAPGRTYETKGIFTWSERSPDVCYRVSVGNVIWSIILIESVIFPVYFIGWSILNPVRMKTGKDDACTD